MEGLALAMMLSNDGRGSTDTAQQLASALSGTGALMRGSSSSALSTMALLGDEQAKAAAKNEVRCSRDDLACF